MSNHSFHRRLRIEVSDEDTGEQVAIATGVETLVLLVAPDTLEHEASRRILVGDPELSIQLLLDIVRDVSKKMGQGSVVDLTDELDDGLLVEMTDGLPLQ